MKRSRWNYLRADVRLAVKGELSKSHIVNIEISQPDIVEQCYKFIHYICSARAQLFFFFWRNESVKETTEVQLEKMESVD